MVAIQVASQHRETIISQPEKPGVKEKSAVMRNAHSAGKSLLLEPGGQRVGGSITGGWLRAAVPETRDSPLKDTGSL